AAGVAVESKLRVRIAHVGNRLANQVRDLDISFDGDLARNDGQAAGQERLDRNPRAAVLGEKGVEQGIGNLIGKLVGMPLADALGSVNSHRNEGGLYPGGLMVILSERASLGRSSEVEGPRINIGRVE